MSPSDMEGEDTLTSFPVCAPGKCIARSKSATDLSEKDGY